LWQMETRAESAVRPVPRGTLVEYLAVRLLLDRLAVQHVAAEFLGSAPSDLGAFRSDLQSRVVTDPQPTNIQRAFLVFQLAQILGWDPEVLNRIGTRQWAALVAEIDAFSGVD